MGKKSSDKITFHFCINERSGNRECCASGGANDLRKYAKGRVEQADGKAKVKKADCLGHCSRGPVMEVQPANVLYKYLNESDIDEILTAHLEEGRIVNRLLVGKKKS
jgi:(2Fe-2S) ferredoxin